MPPWPSSMLNDRQATIAMPICDSIVIDRLLVNTSGATASTSTNRLQITKRPTLSGRNSKRAGAAEAADAVDTAAMRLEVDVGKALIASALPRSEQPLGPEDQDQHQEQVRQDRSDLRDRQLQQRMGRRIGPGLDARSEER